MFKQIVQISIYWFGYVIWMRLGPSFLVWITSSPFRFDYVRTNLCLSKQSMQSTDFANSCILYTMNNNFTMNLLLNSSPPEQNGHRFPDVIFKCIFENENARIFIRISLKFVPEALIDNVPALAQVMAWHLTGHKPLPEPMLTQFSDAYMSH